jgi:hypothetical protein
VPILFTTGFLVTSKLELGVEYDIAAQIDQKNGWFEKDELDPEMVQMMIRSLHAVCMS